MTDAEIRALKAELKAEAELDLMRRKAELKKAEAQVNLKAEAELKKARAELKTGQFGSGSGGVGDGSDTFGAGFRGYGKHSTKELPPPETHRPGKRSSRSIQRL